MEAAKRLHTVEEYYFSKKMKEVRTMLSKGAAVINLGIGSPDLPPNPAVIKALTESLMDTSAHKYQSYQGLPELRKAMADFYQSHYQVSLDFDSEILPLIGSKEGIMHISMAYLNPGDAVLIPNPGYPTYSSVTKLVGAEPLYYDLLESNNWQPNLETLELMDLSKVKLMWINFPHMPTGTLPENNTLEALINFARKHQILIVNDNPYSFILNNHPSSIFNTKGAKEVCLELNSLSKTFNMAGWRVGMLMGAAKHIQNVIKVKSNMDSGMFYGIQKGAMKALSVSDQWFDDLNEIYKSRRTLIWELATKLNCTYNQEAAGMFVWAKLPSETDAETFIDNLLHKHHIFVAPGTIFGSNGSGYIRFSLCANSSTIQDAINRIV